MIYEGVKAHIVDQKMLSLLLFFEIVQLSIFTKLILKNVLIKYIQNKVVQLLNDAIFKRDYIFLINWY